MKNLALTWPQAGFAESPTTFAQQIFSDLESASALARDILRDVMQFRRVAHAERLCPSFCPSCFVPHIGKIASAIMAGKPITFVLPAFPGKSPNRAKVLGPLPDMAEGRALQFLNGICDRVRKIYSPGARILLCSDGRVFSDVIGMNEDDVTAYQDVIIQMIEDLRLENISLFTMDDLSDEQDFVQIRRVLMMRFGKPLESLRESVRRGGQGSESPEDTEAHRIYCGITRFLVEDAMHPEQTKSRSGIQKDCRVRAYEVIRRSNAWSELIAERFPEAVRLSIHPQSCGASKLGIQLLGTDSWMTPWHGVAVDTGKGFVLMKRWEAEQAEAQLVLDSEGRASHFLLTQCR